MIGYSFLLMLAVALNFRDMRMLLLSGVVGAAVFVPIGGAYFYLACAAVEVLVALSAAFIAAPASKVIIRISGLLILFHALGWLLNGYPPESPYHIMVRISEHAELLACVLLSRPLTKMVTHV